MFSCEKYEIFKNTYFEEHLWATASIRGKIHNFQGILWDNCRKESRDWKIKHEWKQDEIN